MRTFFPSAALAAVALCASPAAAQYTVTGNNVYVVVQDKAAPKAACNCPLTPCTCGPACACPGCKCQSAPAAGKVWDVLHNGRMYTGLTTERARAMFPGVTFRDTRLPGVDAIPTYTAPVGGTGLQFGPSFGSNCPNGRCGVVQYVR